MLTLVDFIVIGCSGVVFEEIAVAYQISSETAAESYYVGTRHAEEGGGTAIFSSRDRQVLGSREFRLVAQVCPELAAQDR